MKGTTIAYALIAFAVMYYAFFLHESKSLPEPIFRFNTEKMNKWEHYVYRNQFVQFPVFCQKSSFNGGRLGGNIHFVEINGNFYAVNDYAQELMIRGIITIERGGFIYRPVIAREGTYEKNLIDTADDSIEMRCGY